MKNLHVQILLVILFASSGCSLFRNSFNETEGDKSPLTIIDGDDNDVKVINREDKFIYEPKDNRTYEDYFIDKSIHYHSKIYHQIKVEIRELNEEKVILKKKLDEGKIDKYKYNERIKEIDETIEKKNGLLPKIDDAYKIWSGDTSDSSDSSPPIINYMVQIASVSSLKDVCNYNDSFDYGRIEFIQTSNGYYLIQIGPYNQYEVEEIIAELQPKYGKVKKVAR